MNLCVSL